MNIVKLKFTKEPKPQPAQTYYQWRVLYKQGNQWHQYHARTRQDAEDYVRAIMNYYSNISDIDIEGPS